MSGIGDLSAAERNKQPIFDALTEWLTAATSVLEIGSGEGIHARYARKRLPHIRWQPSETPGHWPRLAEALSDVRDEALRPPLALDVLAPWPMGRYEAIFAANVAHIMSVDAVEALFSGASGHLAESGLLCLYGPFFSHDEAPGEGNMAFDRALRARDPKMGIRGREALNELADAHGLSPAARLRMPSDNRLLIWRCD